MTTNTLASAARKYHTYQTAHMSLDLAFGDNGVAKAFPNPIPADAIITSIETAVNVLFNDSGTDLVKVGITSGGSELAASVDVSSVGVKASTTIQTAVTGAINPQVDTTLYAQYNGQNSDMTTGKATVIVNYKFKG